MMGIERAQRKSRMREMGGAEEKKQEKKDLPLAFRMLSAVKLCP